MSVEKLEKKLALLRNKKAAFDHVLRTLQNHAENPSFTDITREAYYSLWRVANNMVRMIDMAINKTELALKR